MIIGVVAVGSWWSSRIQPEPNAVAVTSSAVVVSSLACTGGAGTTLVDVLGPAGGTVRATLPACGFQEGQQLTVTHPVADPRVITLAESDPVTSGSGLLSVRIGIVVVLALGAGFVVVVDSRRSRRPAHLLAPVAAGRFDIAQDSGTPAVPPPAPARPVVANVTSDKPESADLAPTGSNGPGRSGSPAAAVLATAVAAAAGSVRVDQAARDLLVRASSPIDLGYPLNLNLSATLHDELFTHRRAYP